MDGVKDSLFLVINRVMAPKATTENKWLSISHTMCTDRGILGRVMIDNGSPRNNISQEMVDKSGLKVEKLGKPYKVAWLNRGR